VKLLTAIALTTLVAACPIPPEECTGSFAEFVGLSPVVQPAFEACVFCSDGGEECGSPGLAIDGGAPNEMDCEGFMCRAVVSGLGSGEHELSFSSAGQNASTTVHVVAGEPRSVPSIPLALALATAAFAWVRHRG